jgi:hypothetical protein
MAMPDWAPVAHERAALVLDLPGDEGVWLGLALAELGYRPVPLYNACPRPLEESWNPFCAVDVESILRALVVAAPPLEALKLAPDAPPAFLLDSRRRDGQPAPGQFDNRSVSLPTDFPSANFLLAHDVGQVLLVQHSALQPQADLAHTLRRWQDAGIGIRIKDLDTFGAPTRCEIDRPRWYGWLWYRLLLTMGLRRNALGGYGATLVEPSGG